MLQKSFYLAGALAGALLWSASAQAAPGETTANVLLRSGPGTSYPVVARIPAGAPVDIITCSRWCELGYGGRDGYARPNAVTAAYVPAPYVYAAPSPFGAFDEDEGPWDGGFSFGFHGHHDHGHGGMGHGFDGGHGHGMGNHDGGHEHHH